ncbi:hypothetical protein NDU88_010591 [Pleurodeles waltl]|uniref:Uncharacterized protein n=1 Tax=Pleurodeles waltl TaxID=8319 RepID=A0AAV7S327_PLEWA|nr:hypothetical protein NDU88_010591 [Pleurodeles waltl]
MIACGTTDRSERWRLSRLNSRLPLSQPHHHVTLQEEGYPGFPISLITGKGCVSRLSESELCIRSPLFCTM